MITMILTILFSLNLLAAPAGTKGENGHFKVSEKSLNHLGVKFQDMKGNGPWTIPKEAIVKIKLTEGVYRRFDGEIAFVIVHKLNTTGDSVTITSEDIEPGDEVAVEGAKFLRFAETDLNSETVDNCSH